MDITQTFLCPGRHTRNRGADTGTFDFVITGKERLSLPDYQIFGEPSGIRTPDTLIKSQVLYRLS